MKYFKPSEFNCQCGCGDGYSQMKSDFLDKLDDARGIANVPFSLSSAYRCPAHNEAVGGVEGSAHTKGRAVDIIASTGYQRWQIVDGLKRAGFERIGISEEFVHVDNDTKKPAPVMWTYG